MADYRKAFVLVVTLFLGILLYRMLAPLWGALAWGTCLAFLLSPFHRALSRWLRGRTSLSAGIIVLLLPVVLSGPLLSLTLTFATQIGTLVTRLRAENLRFDHRLLGQLEEYPPLGNLADWLRDNLTATTKQLQSWLVSAAELVLQSLATTGGHVVLSALGTLIHFFVMLFLLFFLLRDGPRMLDRLVRLVPMEPVRRAALLAMIGRTTRAVVYGIGMTALIQGVLVGIGFALAGLDSAVVFGVLAGLLALLPVGGAALVWGPAVALLAMDGAWAGALFILAWGLGVSVSDNLLRPHLISQREPVSVLVVFVGVVGGAAAFGVIGVIIGPVLLTAISALLRFADESLVQVE